jgi:replicative DNA helicase
VSEFSNTSKQETHVKLPPHSIESEQSVLGGIMIEPEAFDKIVDSISESDFYRRDHRIIFNAMFELVKQHKPIDVLTVSEVLKSINKLEDVGSETYLFELAKNTPGAANIKAYADIVREKSILRQLIKVSGEIAEHAYYPEGSAILELLDEAERKVFKISEQQSRGSGPRNIKALLAKTMDRIELLFNLDTPITGLPTGYTDYDYLTSGFQPADLIIVAGRPSMGKTAFAMNIAEHVAIKTKKPVLVFSMEMPAESLTMRLLSSLGRIDQHNVRIGKINSNDWAKLTSSVNILSDTKLFIDDTPSLTPSELRARARRVFKDQGELGMIVIDYLQLMRVSGNTENRTVEISEISRSLKSLAKELNVPIIALSQLNRSLEQRSDKRPVMSDLRESGAIEQDADLITFIYRDEVYNENSPDKGRAEIIIAKQRNGPIGKVILTFLGQYTRFENYSAPEKQVDR